MYTLVSGRMERILLALVLATTIMGCSDNQHDSAQKQEGQIKSDLLYEEYDAAVRLARSNKPEGLLRLYEIYASGKSAELSEIADEELHYLLYKNTELWIKTFANHLDWEKSQSDFAIMAEPGDYYEFPEGKISADQYKKAVINRLKKIKGKKKEMELANFILQLYREDKKDQL